MIAVVLVVDALDEAPQQSGGHADVSVDSVPECDQTAVRGFSASLKGEKPCGDLDVDVSVVWLEVVWCSNFSEGKPRNVLPDHLPVWNGLTSWWHGDGEWLRGLWRC